MTEEEFKEAWGAYKELYRNYLKAQADIAWLKMTLKSVDISGSLVPGWEQRLETARQKSPLYKNYLKRGEENLAQAEKLQVSFLRMIQSMPKEPPDDLTN